MILIFGRPNVKIKDQIIKFARNENAYLIVQRPVVGVGLKN